MDIPYDRSGVVGRCVYILARVLASCLASVDDTVEFRYMHSNAIIPVDPDVFLVPFHILYVLWILHNVIRAFQRPRPTGQGQ